MEAPHELLTLQEAAAYLRLAPQTLYMRRYRGEKPYGARLGGRVVYRRSDLDAYAEENMSREPAR